MPFTQEINGTSGSFTAASGTVNYTVTASAGDAINSYSAGYGDIDGSNYWIGNGSNAESHTYTFDQQIAGIQVNVNASNTGENFTFYVDGAQVDLNTMITNGDATVAVSGNHSINGAGQLAGNNADYGNSSVVTINVPLTSFTVDHGGSGNGSLMEVFPSDDPVVADCFTAGSLVMTPFGEQPVENLTIGDLVTTRDNGPQPLRWKFSRVLTRAWLRARPDLAPIMFRRGVFGADRDLLVSPGHLMLSHIGGEEVFIPAKKFLGSEGVYQQQPQATHYLHLLFDHHQVVNVNGVWSESFQPGIMSLTGLGGQRRAELFEIFPDLQTYAGVAFYNAARPARYGSAADHAVKTMPARYLH